MCKMIEQQNQVVVLSYCHVLSLRCCYQAGSEVNVISQQSVR